VTAADDTWVEVTSPHFTVTSNAGEKRTRNVAWQFEQVQAVLQRIWPWATGGFSRPIRIYACKDERTMKMLAPEFWERRGDGAASAFVSAADAHYIAVRTDVNVEDIGMNPYRSSYWSYVGLTLTSSIPHDLPPWYSRGLAEVFSNTIVRTKDVQVGMIIPWHLQRLRDLPPLRLAELFAIDRNWRRTADSDRQAHFDASAWALIHYLTFGNQGRNLAAFNKFSIAVGDGADAAKALADAFGGLPAVENEYRMYVGKSLYMYKELDLDVKVDRAAFSIRTVPQADLDTLLARYYVASGRPVEARARLKAAMAAAPQAGAPWEVEAFQLERDGKREEAVAAYTRAAELGGGSYYGDFRLASLSWPTAPDNFDPFTKMEASLKRSLALRPTFAPAHALLANVLLQLNRAADAQAHAGQAVALDRFESYHQLTLARVQAQLGKSDLAKATATRARQLARSEFDIRESERFLQRLR
jgi:Tfp pilus assembly protein PilF